MDEGALLGALPGPDDDMVADLFCPERAFAPEGLALSPAAERAALPGLPDAYLDAARPGPPGPPDEAPPAYGAHLLSALRPLVPLGAGVRVIPMEIKDAGGAGSRAGPEEAAFPGALAQESCCTFLSSPEAEDAPGCTRKKDAGPMVLCQLKGGAQVLCIESPRELKALHLAPQYQDQSSYLQPDVPKPMTTLVGRFLPVPAKLNFISQQLDNGARPAAINGPAFPSGSSLPGPPKITLAGCCDCFSGGDFCNKCGCTNCCSGLRQELERVRAIKACLERNPEAFQPKAGKGKLGQPRPRAARGSSCEHSGCLKSVCECHEAQTTCKNYEEIPERAMLWSAQSCVEPGGLEGSPALAALPASGKDRRPASCISWEVVEATCACLLAQGEEAEKEHCSQCLAEQMVLEEFGRCLSQILRIEFKSKGLRIEPSAL